VGRNCNRCGNKAQENLYISQVGERKGNKVQYMIIKQTNPKQNNRGGRGSRSPALLYGKTMCRARRPKNTIVE
jgi:hypothetical protein